MKYYASLCALVLAGSMPGFAVSANHTSVNPQNQFHFKPTGRRAAQLAAREAKFAARTNSANQTHELGQPHASSKIAGSMVQPHSTSAKVVRRRSLNPPTGKIGFLAASDIPAVDAPGGPGGRSYWPAMSGDFNGDGKTDIISEVYGYNGQTTTYGYWISVVLSNGDGTFQLPILNAIPGADTCPAVVVGDVNGDGKSDILIAHQPGACGNSYSVPTFDVLLSNGDGTFTESTNTNNTAGTTSLAGGTLVDTNADGKLDIIVVDDGNPANVWTLLGNGDGTFQAPTSVTLSGEAGNNLIIADLNGDNMLDIADNDYSTDQLTTYLATSPTTYAAQVSYPTPGSYYACSYTGYSMGVGDLNGDGKPELVTANCSNSGNDITVYTNNGDGTFTAGVYYNGAASGGTNSGPADVYTEAVTIADVNGDGKADIIAVNDDSSDVTVLLGNGDGTVNVPTVGFAVAGWSNTPAVVGDFNGDGLADIIVADDNFSFAYLKGYGDGTFRASRDYYAATNAYSWTYGIATGDFNGDGHPDFVIGNICSSCSTPMGVTVFLSNPDGSLQPGMNFGSTSNFGYVAVADFNGDNKLDIAATDNSTGLVQIFNGDGTGNFTPGSTFNTDLASNSPYGLVVGDFNKDGHPDLAIANSSGGDIAILLNDGSGNFPTPVPFTLNAAVEQGLAVADINGDGNLDLVLPYYNVSSPAAVAVLLGNGDGTFQPEQDIALPAGTGGAQAVALADLNGDGKLDMAVTLNGGGGLDIAIALGNGDGTFQTPTVLASSLQDYTLESPDPEYIQVTDVDGDGNVDLVYTNEEYSTVGVLFGKGDGTFPYDPVEYPIGQANWGLVVTDVNGDGAADVVTASYDYAGVNVLLNNNGTGTLGSYTIGTSAQGATLTAGQSATFTLTITPNNHYNGTVTLSCPANLPALMTCSLSSSSVTLDGLNPQTVTLTITTKAASSSLRTRASVDQHGTPRPRNSAMLLASLNGMGVFGMFLAGGFSKKHNRWSVLAILALAMSFFLIGCGGSSSTGTTNPTPTKSNSTSSVTSSAATTLVGQAVTFTGTVSASAGTPTGTVTFLDGKTTLGTGTLSSGKATFQTSSLAAGVHSITIAYGGNSSYNTSTSTAYSQTVDNPGTAAGNYTVTVTGTGTAGTNGVGSPNQSVGMTVIVQ